jgi:hypothetical protein
VNLPGGHRVQMFSFRVTKLDADNRPIAFELLPDSRGTAEARDCVLWASDAYIGKPLSPSDLAKVKVREASVGLSFATTGDSADTQHRADIVIDVERGVITKNRYGKSGASI